MTRITKRQIKEDKFVTGLLKFQQYFNEHKSQIFMGIGAVAVIAVAVVFFITGASKGQQAAENEYGTANMYLRDFYGSFEQDANRDGIPDGTIANSMVNLNNAKLEYENIIKNHPNSHAAKFATFNLASIAFKLGEYEQAEDYYNKFLNKYFIDKEFEAAARKGLAGCVESQRDFETAGNMYLEIAKKYPDFSQIMDVLHKATLNFAKAGQNDKAMEAFKMLEELPATRSVLNDAKSFLCEKKILDPYSYNN